jgi:hypothetical protein
MNTQPSALLLADLLQDELGVDGYVHDLAAAELCRLHAVNQELLKALTHTLDITIGYACEARKCNPEECETWSWVQRARAAIAKATGEKS